MQIGDVIFYDDNYSKPDYSIVTSIDGYRTYAYWIREKQALTFSVDRPCYKRVGPPVIGKWND